MTPTPRRILLAVALFAAVLAASCANPPPTCSAASTPYKICSDDQVWECPQGTAEQLAAKKVIDDACQQEADPIKCSLDAKYEMFTMTLAADCAAGGQVCVESTPPATKSASCQAK